jgi:hypothetical protein
LDLGDLDTALEKLRTFAVGLAEAVAVCPDALAVAGLERLEASTVRDRVALAMARLRAPAALARGLLPRLPGAVQPLAVRYLLGHTLARAARLP